VHYYDGAEDTPFRVIIAGPDGNGGLNVYHQVNYQETFTKGMADATYSFTYTAPA